MRKTKTAEPKLELAEADIQTVKMAVKANGYGGFAAGMGYMGGGFGGGPNGVGYGETLSMPWTLEKSAISPPISLFRYDLAYAYLRLGLAQTLVDQPVDDAFRGGMEIESPTLDEDDIALLLKTMDQHRDWSAIKQVGKWARLYGGGCLIIATDQNPAEPLNVEAINEREPLTFIAASRWEAWQTGVTIAGYLNPISPVNYYGQTVDPSRVINMLGREAPPEIRIILQGWGMSELERCLRSINAFEKFRSMIFELIDESKIDIYKLQNFAAQLASEQGTSLTVARVQFANWLKNYKNALILDKEDEFDQKQIKFQGLAQIYQELRMNLSSELKIPMNKLFGDSATGFGGGQDAMENYNSLVESDVRAPIHPIVNEVIKLRIKQIFGHEHEFTSEFKPLRILSALEEEEIKTSEQDRVLALYDRQLYTPDQANESLVKSGTISVELNLDAEYMAPNAAQQMEQQEQAAKVAEKKTAKQTKGAMKEKRNAHGLEWLREQKKRFEADEDHAAA